VGSSKSTKSTSTQYWLKKRLAPQCRLIVKNKYFQFAMFLALLSALFLPDLWIIANRPNNHDLDVVLTVVGVMFLFELFVQSVGLWKSYLWTFFFWMDFIGAFSLLIDLTYVFPASQTVESGVGDNAIIMRAARIGKLGARAGRFSKLVKLLRFLPGMPKTTGDEGTARVISTRLITALSTRTCGLIILLVMIMPLFSMEMYPEEDWSSRSFSEILEKTHRLNPDRLMWQIQELSSFFEDKSFYPWRVRAKEGGVVAPEVAPYLPWISTKGPPLRLTNNVLYSSEHLTFEFNYQSPNQVDALMNILLLIVVMILMVNFSLVLSNSVSSIVLQPLEQLLTQVRQMASTIFQSVTDMAVVMNEEEDQSEQESSDDEDKGKAFGHETELLAKVVQKLAVISEITMNKPLVDTETLQGLGEGDRAVIHGFQGTTAGMEANAVDKDYEDDEGLMPDSEYFENLAMAQRASVENAGLSMDLIDSWYLNPLELDQARNHAAVMYFVGPHMHGVEFDPVVMSNFLQEAELGYVRSAPYHNWFHAVDCTHAVYRLMTLCNAETYLSKEERFALLVGAISHDLGHPGLNNTFLIETSHELALRYNDKSPLENMHCSRLFELVSQPKCNVFASLTKQSYYEVRKVCIEAILHTDNAQHFTMIKEVQMLYEVNSEILHASRMLYMTEGETGLLHEAVECFRLPESRKLLVNLFLHTADISNCMKPFRISRIWAWQMLEEFFLQGDAEAKLGVPMQALNDRHAVNRPFSQVGFIEYLVSPLTFAVMKVLPQTEHLAIQMLQNARSWQKQWENEKTQQPTESEKKALNDRLVKLEHRYRTCKASNQGAQERA